MRVIKVQGKGRVSAEPDVVTLSFAVDAEAMDYAECVRTLNARAEDLRASMTAAGLERADLKTSAFSVGQKWNPNRTVFAGYCASHNMRIELPMDKELLNRALRQVAQGHSGAQVRLAFSVKDQDSLRKRVLAEAVRTAKGNAETLASAVGVKLGELQQIDYGWAEVHIYDQEASMLCHSVPGPTKYEADIEPEDVAAVDNVTLVYEISD